MFEALPRVLAAVLQHLMAYGELLCDDTGDALRQWRRHAIGLAVAAVAGALALLLGCFWIVAAAWNGPYRLVAPGALCVAFLLIAAVAWRWTREDRTAVAPFSRLRAELREDRLALAALEGGPPRTAVANAARARHGG